MERVYASSLFFIPAFLDTNQKSKSREVEGGKGSERGSRSVVRPVRSHTKNHPTRTPFRGSSSLFFPPNAQANTNQNKQGEEGERKTRTTKTKPNPERAQASKRARARPLGRRARATAPAFGFLSPPRSAPSAPPTPSCAPTMLNVAGELSGKTEVLALPAGPGRGAACALPATASFLSEPLLILI